jgi:hypothetical protein
MLFSQKGIISVTLTLSIKAAEVEGWMETETTYCRRLSVAADRFARKSLAGAANH